jgi:hypothetical protein
VVDGRARTGRWLVPAGILFASLLGGAAARAARTLDVRVGPAVPFSRAELAEALRLRRGPGLPGSAPESVAVTATADAAAAGAVRLTVGTRERQLALGESRGREAARLVALLALDLLEEGEVDGDGEGEREGDGKPRMAARTTPPRPPVASIATAAAPAAPPPAGWALTPSLAMGPNDGRFELGLEAALPLTASLRLCAYGGYGQARARGTFLNSAVIRGGLGVVVPGGEVQGGGLVRGHWEKDVVGGTISGAWLQGRITLWRGPRWVVQGLMALELAPQRLDQKLGDEAQRTLKVTPLVGVGVTLP